MMKYGEIGRFSHMNYQYIVFSEKMEAPHLHHEIYVPFFHFKISRKSANKNRSKFLDKYDKCYSLVNNVWNLYVIKSLIDIVKNYLNEVEPKYVSFSAYGEKIEQMKRLKFYSKRIIEMNYSINKIDEEILKEEKRIVYYMERKG